MRDWADEEWSDYIREVNESYWEEDMEFQLGIHPTQIKEREKCNDRHVTTGI